MCGIAGLVRLDGKPVDRDLAIRMRDALVHRGPDASGLWAEGPVAFGHRRLKIIDLSEAAAQPMVSVEHRYVLNFNGEIYNFRELRAELEAAGYWFRSNSDTEVALVALQHWGADAIARFNGMFAFALYDRQERRLLLARDRYGVKPLYFARQGKRFYFASEQKAILADPAFERRLDGGALYEYFTFQNLFTDRTLLEGIEMLPAGTYATLDLGHSGARLVQTRYWDYRFSEPENPADPREYRQELDRLFTQAVERQLISDVEIGSYLSGGMDSGSITAVAASSFPNLKTFTCGFDLSSASGIELAFDERTKAEAMSARFKTEHYEMVLKAGDMERSLASLAWHLEEPRVGQSYPNYYAALLASRFVKVVMSGAGGDELFGGYPWRYYRAAVNRDFDHYVDQYYDYWQRLVDTENRDRLFAPIGLTDASVDPRQIFREVFDTHDNELSRPEDYINHSLYFEAKTFLHGLFVVEDKLSMAHSLESRVPFMDNDLVDFAMRCPVSLKLNKLKDVIRVDENEAGDKQTNYFRKTNDGKQILRDMMARYIPDDIVKGEKQGFSSPDASWFKGESIDFVRKKLCGRDAKLFDVLDRETVHALVADHLEGRENRRLLIWSFLNVNEYLEQVL
ncbi:asparagine synthase (glutamine-hydrolyzing) [Tsuneonella sp. HG094]